VGFLEGPLVAAGGVTAAAAYGVYILATRLTPEERFTKLLLTLRDDAGEREKFWGVIKV